MKRQLRGQRANLCRGQRQKSGQPRFALKQKMYLCLLLGNAPPGPNQFARLRPPVVCLQARSKVNRPLARIQTEDENENDDEDEQTT
jgi:hypothetical protein